MSNAFDSETWLIDTGDEVIEKKARAGVDALSPAERLIHALWAIDYCMRNAGDLEQLDDISPDCLAEAAALSRALSLAVATETFSLAPSELEEQYFERFEQVCAEAQRAYQLL